VLLACEEQGPAGGPPVLLLHALGEDRTSWRQVTAGLAAEQLGAAGRGARGARRGRTAFEGEPVQRRQPPSGPAAANSTSAVRTTVPKRGKSSATDDSCSAAVSPDIASAAKTRA
jgi:hypothetical protein